MRTAGRNGPQQQVPDAGGHLHLSKQKPLVPAGTVSYAQMLTEANSDVPTPDFGTNRTGLSPARARSARSRSRTDITTISFSGLIWLTKKGKIFALMRLRWNLRIQLWAAWKPKSINAIYARDHAGCCCFHSGIWAGAWANQFDDTTNGTRPSFPRPGPVLRKVSPRAPRGRRNASSVLPEPGETNQAAYSCRGGHTDRDCFLFRPFLTRPGQIKMKLADVCEWLSCRHLARSYLWSPCHASRRRVRAPNGCYPSG